MVCSISVDMVWWVYKVRPYSFFLAASLPLAAQSAQMVLYQVQEKGTGPVPVVRVVGVLVLVGVVQSATGVVWWLYGVAAVV